MIDGLSNDDEAWKVPQFLAYAAGFVVHRSSHLLTYSGKGKERREGDVKRRENFLRTTGPQILYFFIIKKIFSIFPIIPISVPHKKKRRK